MGSKDLHYGLKLLQRGAKSGSFSTQSARSRILDQAASTLKDLGYRNLKASNLKTKHVDALVNHWKANKLTPGTIKNRMVALRWWADQVGKSAVVAKSNNSYGIALRTFITNEDKSRKLDDRLGAITDHHVRMSVRLQAEFGLRREEAIKFSPSYADKGDKLTLKSSWTKGGKAREIPVRTEQQRALLDEARRFAGFGAMIPSNKNYIDQLKTYERNVSKAGFDRLHGLRHAYAQRRYEELTGWKCPIQGGLARKGMEQNLKEKDTEARLQISSELGHERLEVVAIYIGN